MYESTHVCEIYTIDTIAILSVYDVHHTHLMQFLADHFKRNNLESDAAAYSTCAYCYGFNEHLIQ